MSTPFEVTELPVKEMNGQLFDVVGGLVRKVQGIIGQYEILGFRYLRTERIRATGEISIVFLCPRGEQNEL